MNPKVDSFIGGAKQWREEYQALRAIALACPLTEELKWGVPCYTFQDKNVVLIHGFKQYCALLFIKGVLLSDPEGILVTQTENVQAARQVRFTGVGQIAGMAAILASYIEQAIAVERAGLAVPMKETAAFAVPEEFRSRLDADPGLRAAFGALTPGRQRAYLLHFSSARQSRTRESRIGKCLSRILEGKGLDDA